MRAGMGEEEGGTWDLVFSDEFNKDNRSFYSVSGDIGRVRR